MMYMNFPDNNPMPQYHPQANHNWNLKPWIYFDKDDDPKVEWWFPKPDNADDGTVFFN